METNAPLWFRWGMGSLAAAFDRLAPRQVHGISATLLPYTPAGTIDFDAFAAHVERTRDAGLDVAVNMDTGFGDLLSPAERAAVLDATRATLGADVVFYAGAFADGADVLAGYHQAIAAIEAPRRGAGDHPAPRHARRFRAARSRGAVRAHRRRRRAARWRSSSDRCSRRTERSGTMTRSAACSTSSASPAPSTPRSIAASSSGALAARDRHRPDFRVYTGNDLAIDMVAYGSDYLLGLSTFAPAAFAARDRALADGDAAFLALNDALQHLGNVGFRAPVPAYKHSAAMFLHLTGALDGDAIHPRAARRPPSDRILLLDCAIRLGLIADPERAKHELVEPFL